MDITVEEKLRLLQKIREDESQNQNAIQMRSELLSNTHSYQEQPVQESAAVFSFKIRFIFAILLFAGYLAMQFGNFSIGSFTAEKVVSMISESTDIKSFDFPLRVTYTLEE